MRQVARSELIWAVLLGAALFASAVALVELHCRARQLYIDHEREVDVHRRLLDEQADLEMKVRRASLAGNIAAGASMLGLEGATGADTVTLVERADGSIDLQPDLRRELDAMRSADASAAASASAEQGGRS